MPKRDLMTINGLIFIVDWRNVILPRPIEMRRKEMWREGNG
jgi:hypothetical protein